MNLIFRKNEDNEISIKRNIDGIEFDFDYISMIKEIMKNEAMGEPVIEGDFTEEEIKSIQLMVSDINAEAKQFYENDVD